LQLSEAVVVYYGDHRRSATFPENVFAPFGTDAGAAFIDRIRLIQADVFASPPDWDSEALEVLGNYFAFEWK